MEKILHKDEFYDKATEHENAAREAAKKGDEAAMHAHLADYHDNLSQWHDSKGRSNAAIKHAEKCDYHANEMTKVLNKKNQAVSKLGESSSMKKSIQQIVKESLSKLDEEIRVDHTDYEHVHSKSPRGKGVWFFSSVRDLDFHKHKEGHDYIAVPYASYSVAKKKAKEWAKAKGHKWIKVGEQIEVTESHNVDHRDLAVAGKMHPSLAKYMKVGQEMDYYHPSNGDKVSGIVQHNDGKTVVIKSNKREKVGKGNTHHFTISDKLDESKTTPEEIQNIQESRKILEPYFGSSDDRTWYSYQKNGIHRVRGFFHRNGKTSANFADNVTDTLRHAGIPHKIIGHGTIDKPLRYGARVKQNSHWWVDIDLNPNKLVQESRKILEPYFGSSDDRSWYSDQKNGIHRVRRSFLYSGGKSSATFMNDVQSKLHGANIPHKIVGHGTVHKPHKPYREYDPIKDSSHWWVDIDLNPNKPVQESATNVSGLGSVSNGPMASDGSLEYDDINMQNLNDPKVIDRYNIYLSTISNNTYADPNQPLERAKLKLGAFGLGFDNAEIQDDGTKTYYFKMHRFGGTFAPETQEGERTDGITNMVPEGLLLKVDANKLSNSKWSMNVKIVNGSELNNTKEEPTAELPM